MKRAITTVQVFNVACPHCRSAQPEPDTGSFMWDVAMVYPEQIQCAEPDCGKTFKLVLPQRVSV